MQIPNLLRHNLLSQLENKKEKIDTKYVKGKWNYKTKLQAYLVCKVVKIFIIGDPAQINSRISEASQLVMY